MPDPVKMLKDDHAKVKKLFTEFENADGRSKGRIAKEAMMELEVHAAIEEEIFYPRMEALGKMEEIVAEAEEEHHVAKTLIGELQAMERAGNEIQYDAKFMVLMENVRHHIQEEEKEMLPKASKAGKEDLEMIGGQMMERKEALMVESGMGAKTR